MASDDETPENWSLRRWDQLERLERLLRNVAGLNRGNRMIEHLQEAIREAEDLVDEKNMSDAVTDRKCLMRFLKEQARFHYGQKPSTKRRRAALKKKKESTND